MGGASDKDWNVVVVARERSTREALEALSLLGRFRASGFPLVLTGWVDWQAADGAADAAVSPGSAGPLLAVADALCDTVLRFAPMDNTVRFDRDDVTEVLCVSLEQEVWRVCGKSFYVRSHLRGMKGRLEHVAVERALGAFLIDRCAQAGKPASVTFDDPDLVILIEVVGNQVGYGILDRRVRSSALVRAR